MVIHDRPLTWKHTLPGPNPFLLAFSWWIRREQPSARFQGKFHYSSFFLFRNHHNSVFKAWWNTPWPQDTSFSVHGFPPSASFFPLSFYSAVFWAYSNYCLWIQTQNDIVEQLYRAHAGSKVKKILGHQSIFRHAGRHAAMQWTYELECRGR